LAQLYSGVGRHDAALEVLEHYQQQDRYNLRVQQAIHNLRSRSGRGVD
jgi:hypothetical protein